VDADIRVNLDCRAVGSGGLLAGLTLRTMAFKKWIEMRTLRYARSFELNNENLFKAKLHRLMY
jgi:hypothetical protein